MIRTRVVIVLCSLWGFLLTLPSLAQRSVRPTLYNEIYGAADQRNRRLDLYLPEDAEAAIPVVMLLHGSPGDKNDFVSLGIPPIMVGEGYAVISVNYTTQFRLGLADTYCALGWIAAHAADYQFDVKRIALFGVSYGGYMSALLAGVDTRDAYMTDCPNSLPDDFKLAGVATNAGVFFASEEGIISYLESFPEPLQDLDPSELAAVVSQLRENPPNTWRDLDLPDSVRQVLVEYPIYWVNGSEPPHLLIHGVGDSVVPFEDAFDYGRVLAQNRVNVDLVIDRLVGHVPPPRVFDRELITFLHRIFES